MGGGIVGAGSKRKRGKYELHIYIYSIKKNHENKLAARPIQYIQYAMYTKRVQPGYVIAQQLFINLAL